VFDFRYHVASLAAVFLALVLGILVGVGISGRGLVDNSERKQFNRQIDQLQNDLDLAQTRLSQLDRQQQATQTFADQTYPALMESRLAATHVAVVVIGRDQGQAGEAVDQALRDADAPSAGTRYRALKVPVDVTALRGPLSASKQLATYAGAKRIGALARTLAQELVHGGKTPLWDALSGQLVEELRGNGRPAVNAVVVVRTAGPQTGATAVFLNNLYAGLATSGVPAVGVDTLSGKPATIRAYSLAGLSTVDDVETPYGKLALALLLAGADRGQYGFGTERAPDGLLPPVVPLPVAAGG
jgi:hypothetical protein